MNKEEVGSILYNEEVQKDFIWFYYLIDENYNVKIQGIKDNAIVIENIVNDDFGKYKKVYNSTKSAMDLKIYCKENNRWRKIEKGEFIKSEILEDVCISCGIGENKRLLQNYKYRKLINGFDWGLNDKWFVIGPDKSSIDDEKNRITEYLIVNIDDLKLNVIELYDDSIKASLKLSDSYKGNCENKIVSINSKKIFDKIPDDKYFQTFEKIKKEIHSNIYKGIKVIENFDLKYACFFINNKDINYDKIINYALNNGVKVQKLDVFAEKYTCVLVDKNDRRLYSIFCNIYNKNNKTFNDFQIKVGGYSIFLINKYLRFYNLYDNETLRFKVITNCLDHNCMPMLVDNSKIEDIEGFLSLIEDISKIPNAIKYTFELMKLEATRWIGTFSKVTPPIDYYNILDYKNECNEFKKTLNKGLKNEPLLFIYIKEIYPDAIYQFSDKFLEKQSLDIYIPSKKIGIEYNGKQHYEPVEHFGGINNYIHQLKRDEAKKIKCLEHGIKLLEWHYLIPITQENVNAFIRENFN